jgi:GNAT superfamily N-acetyltransferase
MDLQIRSANTADVPELTRLSAQLGYIAPEKLILASLEDLQAASDHEIFVAELGSSRLIGFVHVFLSRRLFIDLFAELGGLIVDDQARNSGIGRRLLEEAENWSLKKGAPEMRVRSNALREGAREFYLGQGYREIKKQFVYLKKLALE